MNIADLPFNRLLGFVRAEKAGRVLSLPDDVRYTNHLGTVHAGALLALAEATSGDYLIGELGGLPFEVVPVVRRVEAKFRKPGRGAVFSAVKVAPEKKAEFLAALQGKGRALFEIPVDVYDAHDTHLLAAVIEWFIARK
jgi:acyl-coenzyme A thioesterase PaaI-like protein